MDTTEKADPTIPVDPAAGPAPAEPGAPAAATNDAPATPTDTETTMQPQVKDSLLQSVDAAAALLSSVAQQIKDAPVSDQPDTSPVPASIVSRIADVASALGAIVSSFAGAPAQDPASPDAAAPAAAPAPSAADQAEAAKALVAKAGRRMSKERLDRFKKTVEALQQLLREVVHQTPVAPKAAATPVVTKAAVPHAIVKSMSLAADTITTLRAKTAKLEGELAVARAEAERLAKSAQTPNGLPFEGRTNQVQSKVTWPMDMNAKTPRNL